jgi:hypothetical protein
MLELEPDLVTLLESDGVILVGTVAADGLPEASRGWGLTVRTDADPPEIRLLVPAAATRARENLEATGRIAVTVTDVETLRSAQVKGRVTRFEPATAADARAHERSFAALSDALHRVDATDPVLFQKMKPGELTVVVATAEEVYDQTPGPAAGVRLAPTAGPQ